MSLLVIGATKVDAHFGKHYFEQTNLKIISCYLSETPGEQTLLQLDLPGLTALFHVKIHEHIEADTKCIIIYCNSLSGSLDLDALKNHYKIPIITPMEAYKNIANQYNSIGVIAGNCHGLAHIGKLFLRNNPNCSIKGFCSLDIVNAIESGAPPDEIINKYAIVEQCTVFKAHQCELIIIGCTHFTWFLDELRERLKKVQLDILLIEPSLMMLSQVRSLLINASSG